LNITNSDYLFAVFVYVLYRTPRPDEKTVERAMKEMQKNNIDVSKLVVWSTDHCKEVESALEGGSAA